MRPDHNDFDEEIRGLREARALPHRRRRRRRGRRERGAGTGDDLALVAARFFITVQSPGLLPVMGAAAVLIGAAVVASLVPATRASHVDVVQALRSE
jgi:hypothetical protein